MPCPQHPLKSIAGPLLVGPGLFLLYGHLVGAAAQLSRLFEQTPGSGLVSSIMLAAAFGPHRLLHDAILLFWPLLLVIAGTPLLWDACTPHPDCEPCP